MGVDITMPIVELLCNTTTDMQTGYIPSDTDYYRN